LAANSTQTFQKRRPAPGGNASLADYQAMADGAVARRGFEELARDEQLEMIRLVASWGLTPEGIAWATGWSVAAVRWALAGETRQ
jgi:hypothetical protein